MTAVVAILGTRKRSEGRSLQKTWNQFCASFENLMHHRITINNYNNIQKLWPSKTSSKDSLKPEFVLMADIILGMRSLPGLGSILHSAITRMQFLCLRLRTLPFTGRSAQTKRQLCAANRNPNIYYLTFHVTTYLH